MSFGLDRGYLVEAVNDREYVFAEARVAYVCLRGESHGFVKEYGGYAFRGKSYFVTCYCSNGHRVFYEISPIPSFCPSSDRTAMSYAVRIKFIPASSYLANSLSILSICFLVSSTFKDTKIIRIYQYGPSFAFKQS